MNLAAVMREKENSNISNFILTTKPTEALVQIAKPDYEAVDDGNVTLSNLVEKKCHLEIKKMSFTNKDFKKPLLKKCSLIEESIVNINLETLPTFQVFIEIEGMLNKIERCLKLQLMNL